MINVKPKEGPVGQALRVIETNDRPSLALELPPSTTFEQWVMVGRQLCLGQQAVNWHIGDWWVFGDRRYGERAKAAAEGIFGLEFGSLANLGTVSRAFETSRRHEVLTFTHHAEVASLPVEEADALLARAERDRLSTRDLRREVQAIKAVNENVAGESPADVEKPQKAPAQPLDQRELIAAYETVIEFADALRQHRELTRRENDLVSVAMAYVQEAHSDRRPCPEDFDIIFVEQGRVECENWYGASRITVNRWLIESGKRRLIELRAAFVRHQRETQPQPKPASVPVLDGRQVEPGILHLAADFLRTPRGGGWAVSSTGQGDWWVGQTRRSPADMVDLAAKKGFDLEGAEALLHSQDYLIGQLG